MIWPTCRLIVPALIFLSLFAGFFLFALVLPGVFLRLFYFFFGFALGLFLRFILGAFLELPVPGLALAFGLRLRRYDRDASPRLFDSGNGAF